MKWVPFGFEGLGLSEGGHKGKLGAIGLIEVVPEEGDVSRLGWIYLWKTWSA